MDDLADTANQVGIVVSVIQSIAEQTNLLALNAAIEAARAGEQGRGFAVVADEVRSLASKTHESTNEIQSIISSLDEMTAVAVKGMEAAGSMSRRSVEDVNKAGQCFREIMRHAQDTSEANQRIETVSKQQRALASELKGDTCSIVSGAKDTHASTNQLTVIISQLGDLSESIQKITSEFKV